MREVIKKDSLKVVINIIKLIHDFLSFEFSPVDFGDEKERLWAYLAVFIILARRILLMFSDGYVLELDVFSDPDFMEKFGWVTG